MSCKVLLATVLGGLLCSSLPAAPILNSSTFNISGTVTVTPTTISWTLGSAPFTSQKATIDAGATGSFVGLAGTLVTIRNLTNTPGNEPVNTPIPPPHTFITFDTNPSSLPAMNLGFIFGGIYNPADCIATPALVGQSCSPAGSPFNFVNNPPPAPAGPQATVTFATSGTTADGLSTWTGNFTSQFTVPYQTILTQLGTQGSVTNTFSATFRFTDTQVPEAGTMSLLGLGLVGLSIKLRRRRA